MTPSSSRTIYQSVVPAGTARWPSKYQGDALDFSLNMSAFCDSSDDTVTSLTVDSPEGSGLVILWSALSTTTATVALQGGEPGTHPITVTIETNSGRRYVREILLTVLADNGSLDTVAARLEPPSNAMTQPSILTLPDGRLLTL